MGWSKKQQIIAVRAAKCAAWNDERRYVAMRHVGCQLDPRAKRPSVHHPKNTNTQFDAYMALAESCALSQGEGDNFPRPAGRGFWRDVALTASDRVIRLLMQIDAEARRVAPDVFNDGTVSGFIMRMTQDDGFKQPHIDVVAMFGDLDAGQAYRVLEGFKNWVGREMHKRGHTPVSFKWTMRHYRRGDGEELAA